MRLMIPALALAVLSGCGEAGQVAPAEPVDLTPTAEVVKRADSLVPASPELAAIYDRSCRSCHSVEGLEAPLTGHAAAWQVRIDERGKAGLLQSTKNGYNAMPSMGQCNDCSDDQLTELIDFMANGA